MLSINSAKQSLLEQEIASSPAAPRNDLSSHTFRTIPWPWFFFILVSSVWLILPTSTPAGEQTLPTHTEVRRWVATNLESPPLFKEGDVLTQSDLVKLRPFLPPGYVEEFDFAEVELQVSPSGNYAPHADYLAATEKFLHQEGGTATPLPGYPEDLIQGGGTVERYITALYRQAYHTHLAHAAQTQYLLPLPGAREFEYKHYLEFLEPYDVRGMRYLVYRYDDARKQDDAWAFLPRLRKVRRLSVQERDTPLAGTEMTLDDFTGFSGRVLDHQWTFLGQKTILHVMNSRHPYARFFGPNGWLPNDQWELRPCIVVEQTPREERSYGRKIFFWDAQTYETVLVLIFDRQGTLWKVNHLLHGWSEDPTQAETDRGKRLPRNIGSTIIDLQKQQATVFSASEVVYPQITSSEVFARYDINVLTEGKR
jgi:hypothetical protein